ncbi:MAG: aminotransferase class I/II-fold pyridoxal phosphate-dependent enzyme, partial [Candidatus Dojkabacteria bacterium]|nr:aminotransferase class I/II-fold pyridoxal phosphate-dependent enzyme [Candidatus Dojkabacteria bacterium]
LELGVVVVVDEVYSEFSNQTCINLLKKYNNLIIIGSFSKTFGLAGLRVGYILSSGEIISFLSRVELSIAPFDVPTLSLVGAIAAIENAQESLTNIEKINKSRIKIQNSLRKLGLKVYPSKTSFLLFSTQRYGIESKVFVERLEKEFKIVLKDASIYAGLSKYDSYIAIPKEKDIPRVISAVERTISRRSKPPHLTKLGSC